MLLLVIILIILFNKLLFNGHLFFWQFRNQYDNDVTVWSPQGRIHQVEYAMEAVKQGSATIGLKSRTHAVIVALKRATSELSAYQKKIIPIDNHMGITIAGLTADARFLRFITALLPTSVLVLTGYWQIAFPSFDIAVTWEPSAWTTATATMNHCPFPDLSIIWATNCKSAPNDTTADLMVLDCWSLVTMYAVILFVILTRINLFFLSQGKGPHIYQTCPSATFFDCKAMAIGARSQSARTYLEKHLNEFLDCSLEDLVRHGLRALRDTLPNEVELSSKVRTKILLWNQSFRFVETVHHGPCNILSNAIHFKAKLIALVIIILKRSEDRKNFY